jgi:hypothetical protein
MLIMMLLPMLLLVSGVFLLTRGLRGYAIDGHPVCRTCDFDLVGLPADSARCSECGTDLATPGAVRTGNRRRRPKLAVAGGLLIVPAVLMAAVLIFANVTAVQWVHYAPHWYLLRQATSPTAATHKPALAELSRRQSLSVLSDAQITSMIDAGLAQQADRAITWVPQWGDLIESARGAGKVPDEAWRRYLTNAPGASLAIRPEIRRGDPLIVRVRELPARCGARANLFADIRYEVQPDSDLVTIRNSGSMGSSLSAAGGGTIGHNYDLDPNALAAAPDGPKTFHVKAIMDLFASEPTSRKSPPDATATFDLRGTWTLVPADRQTARPIDDPSHRPAVERSIKIDSLTIADHDSNYVQLNTRINNPPVPLAYRVFLRSGDREWPFVNLHVVAGQNTGWGTGATVKGFDADRVDLVCRPDPQVAMETVDLHEYWDGEIVIKDVPVKRPTAVRQAK